MSAARDWISLAVFISYAGITGSGALAGDVRARSTLPKAERARVAFAHELPRMNGDTLAATVVEVNYGPGEFSAPHSHPCPVIGYVLEGAIRTQVKGEAEHLYKVGESFYEAPNGIHQVSANASDKEPAKFLAYFVCDHEAQLSVDVSDRNDAGRK
jgi:quercetin dioxygenase-like cupin family protein